MIHNYKMLLTFKLSYNKHSFNIITAITKKHRYSLIWSQMLTVKRRNGYNGYSCYNDVTDRYNKHQIWTVQ